MRRHVDLAGIRQAREDLEGLVNRTPCVPSRTLSRMTGCDLHLKLESLQKTGSFKPRGALFSLRRLAPEERSRGVITVSAGNHAQAVAWAASVAGCPATVVMPEAASPAKVEASRGYGAEVVLHGDVKEIFGRMEQIRAERSLVFIHPFDSPWTVAGQGTVGLEILDEVPDVDLVVAGIGGGGLISGVALAIRESRPASRVIGVEPEGAAVMRRSLDRGRPEQLDTIRTIADGLAAPFAGDLNFEIVRRYVDDVVTVTDDEIVGAMRLLLERCKLLAEPAGAAATAALLAGRVPGAEGSRVVSIVSGGNVSAETLARLLSGQDR